MVLQRSGISSPRKEHFDSGWDWYSVGIFSAAGEMLENG
jgi:hypothetical protein